MGKYTAHLRYTIGDPLEEILGKDLDTIGKAYGADISFERIDKRVLREGMMREETLDKPIEEISQEVITVRSDEEKAFRKAIEAIYEKYRSPRTPYGFWGSSRDGERIAKAIADKTGGGW
ncbi:MAG: hypothetical protein V1930_09410 [Pseudomonadota bacterium]